MPTPKPLRVAFLIENGSYRFDNRALREVGTLRDQGAKVTVVCPAYEGETLYEVMDGVEVYRYRYPEMGASFIGHLGEYATSLAAIAAITEYLWWKEGFDVIQVVNPPDLLWMVAAPYKLRGVKFVFDHYDLNPELFEDRFGDSPKLMKVLPAVRFMERMSIQTADRVMSTNYSYAAVATGRCGKDREHVHVVRNGPDQRRFKPVPPDPKVRALGRRVVGYLGNMNPQDGLDHFVEMARILVQDKGRDDFGFVLIGKGDAWEGIRQLRDRYGLTDRMMMPGRLPLDEVVTHLCATDICVQPDPPGGLNENSTMNKPMEFMALGKAVVSYDLKETRVTGGDVVQFVPGSEGPAGLARRVLELADDAAELQRLSAAGIRRVDEVLGWPHQAPTLLAVYESLFPGFAPEHRGVRCAIR
jgi:glycosyltransferase involved in cell wall biosynthesis